MKNAELFLLLFVFAVSAVVATHDEWVPSEAENEGPGVLGAWKGLLVRAGKKKDRIEIVARGSVGGRGPSDLGVGDSWNDTLRASHACVVLQSNAYKHAKNSSTATAPTAPSVDVGERIQVRDDGEPNGWEWGVVASVSEPSVASLAAGGGLVPKVAKDGWGGEAFAWHAWRRGPGHQETLSFPKLPVHKKADKKTSKSKADKDRKDADAASANSAKSPKETGGGLPGLPSSGLALVACPLHEALTFANSLPEHTDVAVYLAPMVFHPLRPLPMLSRSLTVQGARAAADANGTLLQLAPSSPTSTGEEGDEVEAEVEADGSSSGTERRKKKETSEEEEELSAEPAVPLETEPYPFHDAYQDSSFNPRQPGAVPGGSGFVGPKFRLSSVLHGSWGAAEATKSTRFEGDLKDTAVNEDDDRRLLRSSGNAPSSSGDGGGDGGGGGGSGGEGGEGGEDSLDDLPQFPGFAGRYGLAKHSGRDKGYLGPLLRVAPGVECTLDSVGFVGGRALLGGAVYVGHDKDLRDLGQAKEERNKRRATPASTPSSNSGDESGSEDEGDDEDNEVLKRHVIMHAGVRIKNCDFRRNGALFGGAVYVGSGMATSIDDSAFVNNVAYNCGGALYIVEGSSSLHAALSAFHRNRDQCSRHTVVNHFAAPKAGTALPPGTTQNGGGGGGGGGGGDDGGVANGGKGGKGRGEEQDASGAISQGQHLNLDDFFKFKQDHNQKHFMLGQSGGSKGEDEATAGEDEESEAVAQIDGEWRTAVDYLMADQIYGNGAEMRKYDLAANRRRVLEFQSQRPLDYEMALAKDEEKQRELQRSHLRQLQESALAAKKVREEKRAKDAKAKEARAAKKQAKEAKEKAKEAKRAKFKKKSKMLHFDDEDEDAGGDGDGGEYDDTPYEEGGGDDGDYHGLKL